MLSVLSAPTGSQISASALYLCPSGHSVALTSAGWSPTSAPEPASSPVVDAACGSPKASLDTHLPCDTSKCCPSGHSFGESSVSFFSLLQEQVINQTLK